MNKENILKLIEFVKGLRFEHQKDIETDPEGMGQNGLLFNMQHWVERLKDNHGNVCGTVMCLGGAIAFMLGEKPYYQFGINSGARWLGVDYDTADALFYPMSIDDDGLATMDIDWNSINTEVAVKLLTTFMETGKVDWIAAGAIRE